MEILKKLYWSSYSAMDIYCALHNVRTLPKSAERFRSRVIDNNWYSGDSVIEAIGEDPDSVLLEHGLHLGSYCHKYLDRSVINRVITFSDFRCKLLESINKEAVPVGPYIHYVSECEIRDLPKEYVLYILSHSSSKEIVSQPELILDQLEWLSKLVQKELLIQIHPNDKAMMATLEGRFKWITAGSKTDPLFLHRVRTIIANSSLVIVDSIGTHIGYIHLLGKQMVYVQSVLERIISKVGDVSSYEKEMKINSLLKSQKDTLMKNMVHGEMILNDSFFSAVEDYWGFKYLK